MHAFKDVAIKMLTNADGSWTMFRREKEAVVKLSREYYSQRLFRQQNDWDLKAEI